MTQGLSDEEVVLVCTHRCEDVKKKVTNTTDLRKGRRRKFYREQKFRYYFTVEKGDQKGLEE